MKYMMLVLKNLMRSKRRTILTVLSIAVSLFIFSALVSMPAKSNVMPNASMMGHAVGAGSLTVSGVASVGPVVETVGTM